MSTATSLLTPATSSLTRISIGWLKPNFTPGTFSESSLPISSISASRVSPGRQFVLGLEHGPDVGLMNAHHVVGDFRAAGLAVDQAHLGNRLEQVFDLGRGRHGSFERGRRNADGLDQQVSFVQPRHELAAQIEAPPARWRAPAQTAKHDGARPDGGRRNRVPAGRARLAQRSSQTSFSCGRLERHIAASTGISVSDRSSEPASAKITVSAIGRNSFPSVPWSARIGR